MKKLIYTLGFMLLFTACSKKDIKLLTVQTSTGKITYFVEVADTKEKMIKGLMYRKHMKADHGMLFLFNQTHPQPVTMWMKNTYISLDMLFAEESGKIVGIAQNTEPLSLKNISPTNKKVRAVVELNAGEVKKNNIKIGDYILF